MNKEDYTYPVAHKTVLYPNNGGGITIEQNPNYDNQQFIVVTADQAEWLSEKLYHLAQLIKRDELEWDDEEGGVDG